MIVLIQDYLLISIASLEFYRKQLELILFSQNMFTEPNLGFSAQFCIETALVKLTDNLLMPSEHVLL